MTSYDELLKEIKKIDNIYFNASIAKEYNDKEIRNIDDEYKKLVLKNIHQQKKSILGIDIFKYSSFKEGKQELIPFIFDTIKEGAKFYAKPYKALFGENIIVKENFISTGDGGFFIFPTPLHSLIFNCYIYMALHMFNSGHYFPKLSKYIGGLTIRSAITYDNLFMYENNWYGYAIIKNARILSKDNLNRFLIDEETHDFFMKNFNGLESLIIKTKDEIKEVMKTYMESTNDTFNFNYSKFKNIHVQKLDDTTAKETKLSIYNVEIQYSTSITSQKEKNKTSFIFTMGNSNVINV